MTETANPENNLSIKKVDQKTSDKQRASADTVFVGKKPTMAYVLAIITQFSEGTNTVHVKARGRAISKAVDVAEVVRHKFMKEAKVENIAIATDDITTDDGNLLKVSTIEIKIKKGGKEVKFRRLQ